MTWCEKSQTYTKSNLAEEPTLKLRMNLDITAYTKHSPPLQCTVQRIWKDSLVNNKQFDIVLTKSTVDTGAQCSLLAADHLPDLGLSMEDLLQSEINLNCANSTMAGNLGVFYAKIRGGHWGTGEVVQSKSMVYMIEGNIVLIFRAVLEMLGCIPKHFPRVGEFLEPDDKALTGFFFAVFRGKGMSDEEVAKLAHQETVDKETESRETDIPGPGSSTSVRQPVGDRDPESELPCSCPRRTFADPPEEMPMPAMASNRKALQDVCFQYMQETTLASHSRATHEEPQTGGCCPHVLQEANKGSSPLYEGGSCRT